MLVKVIIDAEGYPEAQKHDISKLAERQGYRVTNLDNGDICIATYKPSQAVRMIKLVQASHRLYRP